MWQNVHLEPKPTTKAHAPWVVNLPPLLSGTAKRERRYFDTKTAAETFCTQQRIRKECLQGRQRITELSASLRDEFPTQRSPAGSATVTRASTSAR